MIGETISHYKILEKLGEGGMGVVYKAQDTKLDRFVALKFLPAHLAASDQDKARFIQEAKSAAALNHPNVCSIIDIQEHEGSQGEKQLFIVMEFIDGQTLQDKKSSITQKQAIDYAIQIAEGLAAAHEKGIVHRDIKPENIMIRKDGIVQVMDFGLAKLMGVSRLTKQGSTVGTLGYMSPEQVQGQETDHRSDIFSFGVLLYEMLTGRSPFNGAHESAILYEIVNVDVPPMSTIKPEIDVELDRIVLECMEKDPNERMQSIKQVAIDLNRFKRTSSRTRLSRTFSTIQSIKTPDKEQMHGKTTTSLTQFFWPLLAGVLALAVIAIFWMHSRSGNEQSTVARLVVPLPKDEFLNISVYPAIAISPDGARIVYRANGRLYLRNLNSYVSTPISGTEYAGSPFFSPDSRWIGFFADGRLKKVLVSGGTPIDLADAPDNRGGVWGKDGKIVFAPTSSVGLSCISDAGGPIEVITVPDSILKERTHRWPSMLPDGKTVLFTVGDIETPDYYDDATIDAVNLETKKRTVVLKGAAVARYLPNGFLVYERAGVLLAVSLRSRPSGNQRDSISCY